MTTITIERELLERVSALLDEYDAEEFDSATVSDVRAALAAPATAPTQPERKPMTDDETLALFDRVKVRMLFTDAEVAPFASGVAAAEHFHGIKDKQ